MAGGGSSKKQSTMQGVVNILLTAVGIGMLTLSSSVAQAGWMLGFGMFFGFGLLAIFLCILLDRSMRLAEETSKADVVKYEDIGQAAFGQWGYLMASLPLHASLIGCSCALIAILAEHSQTLFGLDTAETGTRVWTSRKALSMYWGVAMLPVTWLKTMKHVGVVSSTVGVGAVLVMLVSIIIEGFREFADRAKGDNLPKYTLGPRGGLESVGSPFAALTLAYAVTCTVPTIIRDLQDRTASTKVLTLGLSLTIAVYLLLTLAGYLAWGDELNGAITKSMDHSRFFTKVCKASLILACACHYAVMLHPSCRALEDLAHAHEKWLIRTCLRSALVAGTVGMAVWRDDLRIYVGILGSVTFAIIHSFLPPLFYWRLAELTGQKLSVLYKTGLASIMVMTVAGGYYGLKDAMK